MDKKKLENAPFYAWNCITLEIRGQPDVHLVIRNDKIMSLFIKLLIYKMKTVDGKRGSMDKMIDHIIKKRIYKNKNISCIKQYEMRKKLENLFVHQVAAKYNLMKVR